MTTPTERAGELAAAFATGDLEASGQRELLALLQDPAHGAAAGAAAWREIDTAAALRAIEPAAFVGQVALRMGGDGAAVARAVAARIGARPATLAPMIAPPPPPRGRRRLVVLGMLTLIAVAAAGVPLLRPPPPPPPAEAVAVTGVVHARGEALLPGAPVAAGPLTIPAGARLVLRFAAGGAVALHGPASVVVGGGQCALVAGRAAVVGPLLLAAPDAALTIAAGERACVQVEDGASAMAVLAGTPRHAPTVGAAMTLSPGTARTASGATWRWPEGPASWWDAKLPSVEPPGGRSARWPEALLVHRDGRLHGEGRLAGVDRDLPWPARIDIRRRPGHLEILADGVALGRWNGAWPVPQLDPVAALRVGPDPAPADDLPR